MTLSFTFAKDFYSEDFYCGSPATSAIGSTGEGRACSLSGWMTFVSVRGGAMFASDLSSSPSMGWATSS